MLAAVARYTEAVNSNADRETICGLLDDAISASLTGEDQDTWSLLKKEKQARYCK